MVYFKDININNIFIKISKKLKDDGELISPRGLKTLELQHTWIELLNPLKSIITLKERKLNKTYLKKELKWYKSGDLKIDYIKQYSSFWEKLSDSNGTVNSNYGFLALIQKFNGKSQYEWCLNSLKKDKNSRQAIINYNQPIHKYKNNKDYVCTIAQSFIIRNNFLDSIVFMRSNDLIYGFSYDVPWFCLLMKYMAKDLGIRLGTYRHYTTSMHVYEKHFNMINKINNNIKYVSIN